jgi:hypothetical protein
MIGYLYNIEIYDDLTGITINAVYHIDTDRI